MSEAGPERTDHNWVFRYGLREVWVGTAGQRDYEPKPLTKEEFIHPQPDDHIGSLPWHNNTAAYLHAVVEDATDGEAGAEAVIRAGLDFGVEGLRPMCPDVALLRGLASPIPNQCPLHLSSLGATPELVVEVTYHLIRDVDLVDKVPLYHRAGVRHYLIVDLELVAKSPRIQFILYRWTPERFVRVNAPSDNLTRMGPLNAWLGKEGDDIRAYDQAGRLVPTFDEMLRQIRRNKWIEASLRS